MVQADRVTNAIRSSITGAGAKQSTNRVALTNSTAAFITHPVDPRVLSGRDLRQTRAFLSYLLSGMIARRQNAAEPMAEVVA
jgi:hypothetical protein